MKHSSLILTASLVAVLPNIVCAQEAGPASPNAKHEADCRKQSYERYAEGTLNRASRAAYIAQCMRGEEPNAPQARTPGPTGFTLRDVSAMGGRQLGVDELKPLLVGVEVKTTSNQGRIHTWVNNSDGNLVATYLGSDRPITAAGRWRVADNGSFCVDIDWNEPTKWCRFVFRAGDRFFGVGSPSDEKAIAYEFGFKK